MKQNNLKYLLSPWMINAPSKEIINLVSDSRQLNEKDLFIAIPGVKKDGRNFILEAIKKQPSAILCESKKKNMEK